MASFGVDGGCLATLWAAGVWMEVGVAFVGLYCSLSFLCVIAE